MSTPTGDAPDTMECRVCQTDVPAGEFCGLCGDFLTEKPGNGPSLVTTSGVRCRSG